MNMPTTYEELRAILEQSEQVRFLGQPSNDAISLDRFSQVLEWSPEDQVLVVQAGITLAACNAYLAPFNFCIPHPVHGVETVGELLLRNLPHCYESACGSWRDWVLGMNVMLADGHMINCGSKAVKNVAGYDLQKLLIGSRGTLAIPLEVTVRVSPITKQIGEITFVGNPPEDSSNFVIVRCLASDLNQVAASFKEFYHGVDLASNTIYAYGEGVDKVQLPTDSIRWGSGQEITDATMTRLMRRTKEIFDPVHKLNPGEFCFL